MCGELVVWGLILNKKFMMNTKDKLKDETPNFANTVL
jgi:hypothetical protein